MTIDARKGRDARELFHKLKDILAKEIGKEVIIEVMVATNDIAKKVRAFAEMSGCQTEIEEKEGYYIARVTGYPCCAA